MRVGIIQSNYIPWRGYFDFIDDVDLFIFHDDVQYTKRDWRNRNIIKTSRGKRWLTVPVKYTNARQLIMETAIDDTLPWQQKHRNQIEENYRRAPFFPVYYASFAAVLTQPFATISELNIALCRWVMTTLNIHTPTRDAAAFGAAGAKNDKLLALLSAVDADVYLSGPAATAYLDLERFHRQGISVELKSYDYGPYPQINGEFLGAVTALDLLFNTGPAARDYLKSVTPNRLVSP